MVSKLMKSFTVAAFGLFSLFISITSFAKEGGDGNGDKKKKGFDAQEVIFGHILDGHEFHFFDLTDKKTGKVNPVGIPLPVILYSPQRGFDVFMSSKFHHGHEAYQGYRILDEHYLHTLEAKGVDIKKEGLSAGKLIAVDATGNWDKSVKFYDISLTRNVVQMLLALALLVWIMITIAKKYQKGHGVKTAPSGMQNLIEPVITFVRDEVAKPNLGNKWEKYLPYLLTLFFFILINNLFGLIPGTANVTGNIAFTLILGIISFIVILASSKKHYWGHIFNPPGMPLGVKFILVPVEFLSLFIKPMALIIRLFANMVAGHIIIICLISLIFIFAELNKAAGWGTTIFSLAFTIFIYFIEILVAFIQAYIFAMLTAVFVGQAFEETHHEEAHAAH
ncbi:MAG TPA: F0F1 ATP synthase subunit A [Chitinophagaceae bacterium]|nr:F0F1 ATP synthase subunit A [Chitinophagaceae bacterium]